ncbi:hypothetical protein SynBIOSE41_00188 [Synechococcus sp. BIOS-E4-1]|nr:hypothetical protein SynBIOSE41_00188 [Synechococcus sp. BIOS-E4-1]
MSRSQRSSSHKQDPYRAIKKINNYKAMLNKNDQVIVLFL